jgi:hypothetical protein
MGFRGQYRDDVSLAERPYPHDAATRIRGFYRTSTRATKKTIGNALAQEIWESHLRTIFEGRDRLPPNRQQFDKYLVEKIKSLGLLLAERNKGDFGIAQKIVNLFMKELWAVCQLPEGIESNLHAPLDSIVLSKISGCPTTWKAWTKAKAGNPNTVDDYLRIQEALRKLCEATPRFSTMIEMEQFIWHRVRLPEL